MPSEEMLSMEQVLALVDRLYNFAQDPEVLELMGKCNIPQVEKHLIDRRVMLRYFEYYAKHQGAKHYSDVIRMNGAGTKGTKYRESDILKVIKDPDIDNRIQRQIKERASVGIDGILMPKGIFTEYCEMLERDSYIKELTGYTARQVDLWGLEDDHLLQLKDGIIAKIKKLEEELKSEKEYLKDVTNEMKTRRYRTQQKKP